MDESIRKELIKALWKEAEIIDCQHLRRLATCVSNSMPAYGTMLKIRHGGDPHTLLVEAVEGYITGNETKVINYLKLWRNIRDETISKPSH